MAEWIAAAGDIASAYVSSRRSDDPAIYRRIAITASTGGEPSHYVQALAGRDIFIVIASGQERRTNVKRFRICGRRSTQFGRSSLRTNHKNAWQAEDGLAAGVELAGSRDHDTCASTPRLNKHLAGS